METDQTGGIEVNNVNSPVPAGEDGKGQTEQLSQLWHPPIDISHLSDEQQVVVKKMFYVESNARHRVCSEPPHEHYSEG